MLREPAAIPVTNPVVGFTVANAALELLQTPPPVALLRSVVPFEQTVEAPPVVATVGSGLTVRVIL